MPAPEETAADGVASWAAVVLAGGRGSRLGGVSKSRVALDGRTLLDRALAALAEAGEVVVVGEEVPGTSAASFVVEQPPHGGPVAGLLAGRDALTRPARWLAVVAVDMPYLTTGTWRRLLRAAEGHDGSALHDPDGRRQLALVLDLGRLDAASPAPEERHGRPLHRLLAPLDLAVVDPTGAEHHDIDTWDDLRGGAGTSRTSRGRSSRGGDDAGD